MGASSGIGMHTARAFLQLGHRVGVAARRLAPLQALKAEFPSQVECAQIDINASEADQQLLQLIETLGGMDFYLHSSGEDTKTKNSNLQLNSASSPPTARDL